MRYVVDTHALLWYLSGDKRLGPDAGRILDDADAPLIVPVLALAEAKHAADRKRVPVSFERVVRVAALNNLSLVRRDRGDIDQAVPLLSRRSPRAPHWAIGIAKRHCTTTWPTCCIGQVSPTRRWCISNGR